MLRRKVTSIVFSFVLLAGFVFEVAANADAPRMPGANNWTGTSAAPEQDFEQFANGAITTAVYVNEQGPFPLLLDTGAFVSGLNKTTISVNDLDYKPIGSVRVIGVDGRSSMRVLSFNTLHVAGHRLKSPSMLELPGSRLDSMSSMQGVLGTDVLANFTLAFDMDRHKLIFFSRKVDLMKRQPGRFDTIPIRHDRKGNGLTAKIQVNDRKISALIDTGATRTVLSIRMAKRLGLDMASGHHVKVTGINGRRVETRVATLKRLTAGTRTWLDVKVLVMDIPRSSTRVQAILGMDLLAAGPFAIDYGHKRVLLIKR